MFDRVSIAGSEAAEINLQVPARVPGIDSNVSCVIEERRRCVTSLMWAFTDLVKQSSKVVKKVPKGTSSYQAEWILDEDGESGGEGDEYDDIEHEDFMEEESQVRKWALGHPLCIAANARQGAFLTLRGMCGLFVKNSFVVARLSLCFITHSLLELILVWTVYLVNFSIVASCVKM